MAAMREQLAAALATSDVVVVSGETGSGKTTQVGAARLRVSTLPGKVDTLRHLWLSSSAATQKGSKQLALGSPRLNHHRSWSM
jgi:ABC-type phosphonate transport system ATPase subunit